MSARAMIVSFGLLVLVTVAAVVFADFLPPGERMRWEKLVSPGALSSAHASLETNCMACHSPVRGIEAANCIVCHANNQTLLQRQPTAFHANISSCRGCHIEHGGRNGRPTLMDHASLAAIGLNQLGAFEQADSEEAARHREIMFWLEQATEVLRTDTSARAPEATLNCMTCHANDDRHNGFFGADCIQCHDTSKWTIAGFRHPSPASMDCAQCHQAPPSHYMEHFNMISARVARKPHAEITQCFFCHRTTAWNDIPGVGWYKHH